jgi:ribokinase
MSNILVIGSLNADLVVRAQRFPQPGETISGEDLQVIPGGKGANQAVAAARLGASVSMLGRVGKDNFGDFLLDNLKSNSVDSQLIQRDDASTGTAIIVVDSNGQNSIVLSAGANGKVSSADVESASFLHHDLLLLQLEIPTPTVLHAAQRAKENNIHILLNPAPAKQIPRELIALADHLIPNEPELRLLTDIDVKDLPSAEQAAQALLARGAKNVIVTL